VTKPSSETGMIHRGYPRISSLAAVSAGVTDRERLFSLLRLSRVPAPGDVLLGWASPR
jgi:hypothetical protein